MDWNYIVEQYAKNPIQNFVMADFSVKQHEGNALCGDDITIYLKIQWNKIVDYSFDGDCATITKASASCLADIIVGQDILDILTRNQDTMIQHDFIVSSRRKRASVIAILAARNAVHNYLNDGQRDEFDDLIKEY